MAVVLNWRATEHKLWEPCARSIQITGAHLYNSDICHNGLGTKHSFH
uniref:Uncharacterized protein n=1 Tax=Anguilla anguilla TaxID=7936 RepID=A0A0E9VVY3_ANGAN